MESKYPVLVTELDNYLRLNGARSWEGYVSITEANYLMQLVKTKKPKHIGEIGFNAGHSAMAFLVADPDCTVTSFDIGHHASVDHAGKWLLDQFGKRLELIIGDSKRTVPAYDGPKFDLVFIDGGHDFDTASADLFNILPHLAPGATIIMDDVVDKPWGRGPSRAWSEATYSGAIREVKQFTDATGRGWAVGHAAA